MTFACAVAADTVVFRHPSVNDPLLGAAVDPPDWVDQNKGTTYKLFGLHIGDGKLPNPMTAMFCLIVAVVLCYAVANLRRSTTGRQMLALRSNERAAAAAGVSVAGTKILGFALSASIAGHRRCRHRLPVRAAPRRIASTTCSRSCSSPTPTSAASPAWPGRSSAACIVSGRAAVDVPRRGRRDLQRLHVPARRHRADRRRDLRPRRHGRTAAHGGEPKVSRPGIAVVK